MEIVCQNCQSRFKVAREKLPPGRTVSIKCPRCKGKIDIETDTNLEGEAATRPSNPESIVSEVDSRAYDPAESPFDYVQAGMRTALLCEHDRQIKQKFRGVLEGMNYQVVEADSVRHALKYMRFHVYDLVVLNEAFEAAGAESNHVVQYLARLPMHIRRNMFVVLLGNDFRTMDNMTALNKSVNLVVNSQSVDDMNNILKNALAQHEEFYHVFKEFLKQTGRA